MLHSCSRKSSQSAYSIAVPEMLKTYLWIGLGGAIGSMGRFWLSTLIAERVGEKFPWGTLIVNITGSLLIGIFAGIADTQGRFVVDKTFRQFLMVGICGGYTTFSAFSIQTLELARNGQWGSAGIYILASVVFCLIATWLGLMAGQALNR